MIVKKSNLSSRICALSWPSNEMTCRWMRSNTESVSKKRKQSMKKYARLRYRVSVVGDCQISKAHLSFNLRAPTTPLFALLRISAEQALMIIWISCTTCGFRCELLVGRLRSTLFFDDNSCIMLFPTISKRNQACRIQVDTSCEMCLVSLDQPKHKR